MLYVSPVIAALERRPAAGRRAERARQRGCCALVGIRRQEVERRALPHARGAAVHRQGKPGRRHAARRVRARSCASCSSSAISPPAGDGAARAAGRHSGRRPRSTSCARSSRTHPHTRYPVYTGDLDHIVGSVHIKELLRHLIAGRPVTARDARPVPYVPVTVAMDEVLAAMRRHRAQMAVVMDEHGGTAGLVTIEDLFEEVVGEIEEGRGRTPIVRDADGRLLVRGTVRLKDAGEELGSRWSIHDVQSVSGLVLLQLGRPARRRRRRHLERSPVRGESGRRPRRRRGGDHAAYDAGLRNQAGAVEHVEEVTRRRASST